METKRALAEDANEQGLQRMREGRWEQALVCFDFALKVAPGYVGAYLNRAAALEQLYRYREALSDRQEAAALARMSSGFPKPSDGTAAGLWLPERSPVAPAQSDQMIEQQPAMVDTPSAPSSVQGLPTEARPASSELMWWGAAAFVTDVVFGYGPAFVGFYLALVAYVESSEAALVSQRGLELLGWVVGYLFFARLILSIWMGWQSRGSLAEEPRESGGADRLWMWLLSFVDIVTRLLRRPLEAALAFAVLMIVRRAGPVVDLESGFAAAVLFIWGLNLATYIGPFVLGFYQVWAGNGQTVGRRLFGLQVQGGGGRPAGFVRLLLRDGVFRPLSWSFLYSAFGLLLVAEFYLGWIVALALRVLGSKPGLVLRPFGVLWRALAGGHDSRTLHDLLSGTRVTIVRASS